jgi:hypothetical protein
MVRTLDNPDDTVTSAEPTLMTPPPLPASGDNIDTSGVGSLDVEFQYNIKLGMISVATVSGFVRLDAPPHDPDHWTIGEIFLNEVEDAELVDGETGTGTTGDTETLDEQHFLYPLIRLSLSEHEAHFAEKWSEHLRDMQIDEPLVLNDPLWPPAPEAAT